MRLTNHTDRTVKYIDDNLPSQKISTFRAHSTTITSSNKPRIKYLWYIKVLVYQYENVIIR
jgi:hypothetical protein